MKQYLISVPVVCMLALVLTLDQGNSSEAIAVRSAVAPIYTPLAATANTSGDVEVQVTVDKGGNVSKADFVSGHPLLRKAAVEAAKRWRFEGANEERRVHLTFSFRMVPRGTSAEDMTAVFMPPYRIEVRGKLPEPTVNYGRSDPSSGKHKQTP